MSIKHNIRHNCVMCGFLYSFKFKDYVKYFVTYSYQKFFHNILQYKHL